MRIEEIKARKILNSAGKFALEVELKTKNKTYHASAPCGISESKKAVFSFPRDNVDLAVKIFNQKISQELVGKEIISKQDLFKIEEILGNIDKTNNWANIGGNSVLSVEYACIKAIADERKIKIWQLINPKAHVKPRILSNMIGGGMHSFGHGSEFQEFLVVVLNTETFKEQLEILSFIYNELKKKGPLGRNYENAWCFNLSIEKSLDLLRKIIGLAEKEFKRPIRIGTDVAASSFYRKKKYVYKKKVLKPEKQLEYLIKLIKKYNLFFIEDPFEENDFNSFSKLNRFCGSKNLICGDDLTASNPKIVKEAIKKKAINSIIVKPNQIGCLSKIEELFKIIREHNIIPVFSHRSKETEDDILAHLAIGYESPFIKISLSGGERTVKLNEILRILE